jgi:hypothetical protein
MANVDWAREQLRAIGTVQTAIRYWLKGVQASLPPTSPPDDVDEPDNPDVPTHLRAVIGNCLNDLLDPLIRDLFEVADYQLAAEGEKPEAQPGRPPAAAAE